MGLFDHFPYTNVHELNLDWILSMMKALEAEWEAFTAGNSLTFSDPLLHDKTKTYAKNTIVLNSNGNAYVSLQAVPVGVALSNSDYWLMVFDYEAFIEKVNKNFTARYYRDQYRATAAMAIGDWLTVDDVLYKAKAAIAVDDLLIVGANIEHFTLEDFIKAFMQSANQLIQQYKNDIDASELLYRQQLAQDIANTTNSLQAQLDAAIAGATVDSEVINARVGADGVTYPTLGDAIRTQFTDTNEKLDEVYNAVDYGEYDLQSFGLPSTGYYYSRYGTKTALAGAQYFDYINVKEGEVYVISGRYGNDIALVAAYDASNNYVSADSIWRAGSQFTITNFEYTVPAGIVKIGISSTANVPCSIDKKVVANIGKMVDTGEIPKQIPDTIITGSYFSRSAGNVVNYADGKRTLPISVKQGDKFYVSGKYGADVALIVAFDTTLTYSSANSVFDADDSHEVTDYEYTVPSGIAALGFSSNTVDLVIKKEETYYVSERALSNTQRIEVLETPQNPILGNSWNGKKIVWFGTSIPEGGSPGGSYPDEIAQILNCTVYNEAVGSSRVHCKYPVTPTAENPYQMGNGFAQCSRCMTNSLTEMQWIIDNYQSAHWTPGTGQPATMTPEIADFIKSCSYEIKLDKYLTPDTFPDLFVFDHGHNDTPSSIAQHDQYYQQYGTYNLYEFRGAMNFLINRILSYNPRARIVMIGEYAGDDDSIIPHIQMEVSNDWDLPICKNWQRLGWSKSQNVTLYGYWAESGGVYTWTTDSTPHVMTEFDAVVPDGVHPNKDGSGYAIDHMAYSIAKWLITEVSPA